MSNQGFIKVTIKPKGSRSQKIALTDFKISEKNGITIVSGQKVNKEGTIIHLKQNKNGDWDSQLEVLVGVTKIEEVIIDWKYGELVSPEAATQNQPEWEVA
jgi:hypothetical protein